MLSSLVIGDIVRIIPAPVEAHRVHYPTPGLISFSRTLPPGKDREEGGVGTKPVGACWVASKALVGSVSRSSKLIFIPRGVGLDVQGLAQKAQIFTWMSTLPQ